MPDTDEFHLPFFEKTQVYQIFKKQYSIIYPTQQVPTYSYFTAIWKTKCSNVKVRKSSRFSICSTCERLRSSLERAITDGLSTEDLKREKFSHNRFIERERLEYRNKCEEASLNPEKYISLVIDGADQSKFSLPHFMTPTKEERGHGLAVHLIGVLRHLPVNKLHLFTMTDNHKTGANHIIESLHRVINVCNSTVTLPQGSLLAIGQLLERE